MNSRERFLATMSFKEADRYPYFEFGPWGQTYERGNVLKCLEKDNGVRYPING